MATREARSRRQDENSMGPAGHCTDPGVSALQLRPRAEEGAGGTGPARRGPGQMLNTGGTTGNSPPRTRYLGPRPQSQGLKNSLHKVMVICVFWTLQINGIIQSVTSRTAPSSQHVSRLIEAATCIKTSCLHRKHVPQFAHPLTHCQASGREGAWGVFTQRVMVLAGSGRKVLRPESTGGCPALNIPGLLSLRRFLLCHMDSTPLNSDENALNLDRRGCGKVL